ncbi:PDGLE domain-containing protein [Neobacillus sp. WH10]|uniref:PDGLE domain-containing protein n=1 Tax=Neobacillus sp. WH10 TaxID=3047873 RepID=UPI0024C1229E|nr:PDGLE domain-containing protein [Neobacillus sp. WH10]WHY76854.1 PDGLE domain-containing protein [Neobacillus sp. WH10]
MKKRIFLWIAVTVFIAGAVSLLASEHPDGYEKAGEQLGFIDRATSYLHSPLPDYAIPGVDSWVSSSLAGIIGVALTFVIFLLLGKLVGKRR